MCCVEALQADEGRWGRPLDLKRLLNIEGELPVKFYACSKKCRDDLAPTKRDTSKVLRAVLARISDSLTKTLGDRKSVV